MFHLSRTPCNVEVGDQICILFGGKVPCAVRGDASRHADTRNSVTPFSMISSVQG